MSLLQQLTPPVLSLQCVFLIWCMAPVSWNGSQFLYTRVIRPFFLKHEAAMDNVVNNLSSTAKNLTGTVTKEGRNPPVCSSFMQYNSTNSFLFWMPGIIYLTFLHHAIFKNIFLSLAVTRALSRDKSHWATPGFEDMR